MAIEKINTVFCDLGSAIFIFSTNFVSTCNILVCSFSSAA